MKLNFNKTIYKNRGIREAIDQFCNIAEFKIIDLENSWDVEMVNCNYNDKKRVFDEFANYVLSVSQN
ncbi:HxsD-like protein [Candidatus Parcubacteria bacterium]|nr:HxsD-like protein [Candidatus Parcubacteria bacterium]